MRDRPSGAELLEEARRLLLEEIAPGLEGDHRFKALMVGNALAMARRELLAGARPAEQERQRLTALLQAGDDTPALNAALAGRLRAGDLAGDPATYAALLAEVTARVAESNPRALPEDGDDGETP